MIREVIGTTGNDRFDGISADALNGNAIYGLAGNDVFSALPLAASFGLTAGGIAAGGTGNDTYIVRDSDIVDVIEFSNQGFDTLDMSSIRYDNARILLLEGGHLALFDVSFLGTTGVTIYNWDTQHAIEIYQFEDRTVDAAFMRENILSHSGYAGYRTFAELRASTNDKAGFDQSLQNTFDAIDTARYVEAVTTIDASTDNTVFRFYNTESKKHFYTGSEVEAINVAQTMDSFIFEGKMFNASDVTDSSSSAVYRFYSAQRNAHFYTISEQERDNVINTIDDFTYEGVAYNAYTENQGSQEELYRFYNTETNAHFYTTSEVERDNVINTLDNYLYEGVAYYVDVA